MIKIIFYDFGWGGHVGQMMPKSPFTTLAGTSGGSRPPPEEVPPSAEQKRASLISKVIRNQHFLNSAGPGHNRAGRQHPTSQPRSLKQISTILAGSNILPLSQDR